MTELHDVLSLCSKSTNNLVSARDCVCVIVTRLLLVEMVIILQCDVDCYCDFSFYPVLRH